MKNNKENLILFSKVMWVVADDFGGKISEDGIVMRFRAMQEYSIDQITKSGTWLLKHRENTFPAVPTTKEFIDVIEGFEKPKISAKSKAEIELSKVLAKLKYHGRAGNADFEDTITKRLMTVRWPYRAWASTIKTDEIKWFRKEFIEAYQAYSEEEMAAGLLLDAPDNNVIGIEQVKKLAVKIKTMEV